MGPAMLFLLEMVLWALAARSALALARLDEVIVMTRRFECCALCKGNGFEDIAVNATVLWANTTATVVNRDILMVTVIGRTCSGKCSVTSFIFVCLHSACGMRVSYVCTYVRVTALRVLVDNNTVCDSTAECILVSSTSTGYLYCTIIRATIVPWFAYVIGHSCMHIICDCICI